LNSTGREAECGCRPPWPMRRRCANGAFDHDPFFHAPPIGLPARMRPTG
jgi:hypothetical protein